MALKILGNTRDLRSGTDVVYCKVNIAKYMDIIGTEFEDFTIQRKRENHKAYARLKSDLKNGALLPSLTLAVKPQHVESVLQHIDNQEMLLQRLSISGQVDILDGLQRTYIIRDLINEGHEFPENQEVLIEFWLEKKMSKLIYRMIVLNAGQKAMSMRHQVELLFMSLKETVQNEIDNIEIYVEREGIRRTAPNKYPLNVIASAYQAFITRSTELDKNDIVDNRLDPSNSLEENEEAQANEFNLFIEYFKKIKLIDQHVWERYEHSSNHNDSMRLSGTSAEDLTAEQLTRIEELKVYKNAKPWLGSENVMTSLFCAISQMIVSGKKQRVDTALDKIITKLENEDSSDPLCLVKYEQLKSKINPRKSNVGFATRRLILNGFKELFRDEGDSEMDIYWQDAKDF